MYRVMLIIVLATPLGVWCTRCPFDWTNYILEDTCLKIFLIGLGWGDARTHCKNHNGDLVQIGTGEKYLFVEGMLSSLPVWTDLNDIGSEDIYKHVDGRQSIFRFASDEKANCGTIWATGMTFKDCYKPQFVLCEIKSTDRIESEPTSTQQCNEDDWIFDNIFNAYLLAIKVQQNFSTASEHCQALNGRLLQIPTNRTFSHLYKTAKDELVGPDPMFYWIGLRSTDDKEWYWTDGSALNKIDHRNWRTKPKRPNQCAVILLTMHFDWRVMRCNSRNNYICQSTRPCGFELVMMLNEKLKVNNDTTVYIQRNKMVRAQCLIQGYLSPDTVTSFNCSSNLLEDDAEATTGATEGTTDGAKDEPAAEAEGGGGGGGNGKAHRMFTAHLLFDRQTCWCHSEDNRGSSLLVRMTISIVFAPVLLPGEMEHRTFSMQIGGRLGIYFKFKAKPEPQYLNLVRRGIIIQTEGVVQHLIKLPNDSEYAAMIVMEGFKLRNRGSYHLYVGNNIGLPLHLRFDVTVANRTVLDKLRGKAKPASLNWMPLVVINGLVCFAALVGVTAAHKRSKLEDTEESSKEVDDHESMTTTEEQNSSITMTSTESADNSNHDKTSCSLYSLN